MAREDEAGDRGPWIERALPAWSWLSRYRASDLPADLMAGVTVAVMLVPQAMAYAMLAGLPPVVGLYASTLPLIAYALFGSSRQLAVGPVAMVSLLVLSGLSAGSAETGGEAFVQDALLLALLAGIIQIGLGLLRLGALVHLLAHPVVSGFTTAAALIIGLSQMKHLLGVEIESGSEAYEVVIQLAGRLGDITWPAAIIGLASVAALALARRFAPKLPAALIVVGLATAATYFLGLHEDGVAVVGRVPAGLPGFTVPELDTQRIADLTPLAALIVLIGVMESIAVAKTIASKEGYRISPDRELVGLGAANAVAAFLGGYPVTGGFSRSAVNHRAGAVTPLAGVITAGLVTLALLVLTPLFRPMPKAALAAVILVAVASLVDFGELARLWRLKRPDAAVWLTTFVAALVLGSEKGIAVGVGLSLVVFVRRSARPHMAELGYVEDHDAYLNVERFPSARTYEGVYILRVDASMYFANAAHLEDHLRGVAADREDLEHIVLDLAGVNDMDSSALHSLEELLDDLGEAGVALHLAGAKGPVRDLLERASGLSSHDLKTEYQTVGDVLGEITG